MKEIPELIDLIGEHILNQSEDEHFDFKREWHDKFDDLLKDIISMSNLPDEINSYIVIGVSDEYQVVGINEVNKRYKKADISSGIRDYHFSGESVPEIDLTTIPFDGKELDVLEIKSSNSLPYFLTQPRDKIKAYAIYTRVNDSNREATFEECELLWKKRFNLLVTEKERFRRLLKNPDDWEEYNNEFFYKYDSTFRMRKTNFSDEKHPPSYAYIVDDWGRFDSINVILSHNGNKIDSYQIAYLDGCRLELAVPDHFFISGKSITEPISYRGYVRNTLKIALANFFYLKDLDNCDIEYRSHFRELKSAFIVYESEEDKEKFESYISKHYDDFFLRLKNFNIPTLYSTTPKSYNEDIKVGMLLHNLYEQKELWCSK